MSLNKYPHIHLLGILLSVIIWPSFMNSSRCICFGQGVDKPHFVLFGGTGFATQSNAIKGGFQFGANYELIPTDYKHFPSGIILELGYTGYNNDFKSGSVLISTNYAAAFKLWKTKPNPIFFTGGYSRLFGTGNAVNFGGGMDFWFNEVRAIRLEIRDYLKITGHPEHNVALRIGYVIVEDI